MEELHTYLDFLFYCPTQKKTKTSTVTITTHCQHWILMLEVKINKEIDNPTSLPPSHQAIRHQPNLL